jgi:hypothetical protein
MYIHTHIGASSRIESDARAAGSGGGGEVPAAEARSTGGEEEEAHEVLCPRCGQMIDSRFAFSFFFLEKNCFTQAAAPHLCVYLCVGARVRARACVLVCTISIRIVPVCTISV